MIAPGDPQSGSAAEFKRRLIDSADLTTAVWERESSRQRAQESGVVVHVLADLRCHRTLIRPGRAEAHAGAALVVVSWPSPDGGAAWLRPLPPGTVPITFTWLHAGRGSQAPSDAGGRPTAPIVVTTDLALTGDDPGLLSMPELADRALADPEFRAWVDEDSSRGDWDDADLRRAPSPATPSTPRSRTS